MFRGRQSGSPLMQRKTYAQLAQRTWVDVVDEHLQILDRISTRIEKETQA